jgi:hypothetical protein
MKKYAIWNKIDNILTPIGEVLTAEQWIKRYPIAGIDSITVVCSAGEINGAYFGTLGQMVEMYERQGCDFSQCETAQDKLNKIEEFDDERERLMLARNSEPTNEELSASALASIAASLEYQNMMTLDDVEV